MKGFTNFIREQGVMGLAIGFILGGAVSSVVTALVNDIVNPLIGTFIGQQADSLNSLTFYNISYGHFISVLIDFLIIAAVIYFAFKGLKLDKLDKKDK
ncbi:MAG: large conductance mechanosensitive channel protein MscL [Candidatus Colwellbacteria bacterium CG10_big_fil_rev_8_21_14_0_10_41_28]|uniref:Large conductance mechanosensitive channel protein MscL n=1 Tax=Candidatus Colwellbacteria bacterium CG10_big_fil_rev_8_21_14_0_10_41_28 TaxID=1974539 RepID=A0A2H0VGU1_9BACT|nr:MAG: large conductance mechanosensitive channel protein MscL [Candidatus Colwellbacteria bacterium CG10_big_fil_rev_8_21_14_0_10_41_28]